MFKLGVNPFADDSGGASAARSCQGRRSCARRSEALTARTAERTSDHQRKDSVAVINTSLIFDAVSVCLRLAWFLKADAR